MLQPVEAPSNSSVIYHTPRHHDSIILEITDPDSGVRFFRTECIHCKKHIGDEIIPTY